MPEVRQAEVGDGFQVNGHFAAVFHVNVERQIALVRVFADPRPYAMQLAHLNALVHAFDSVYRQDLRA